jgi:hypothetical protein
MSHKPGGGLHSRVVKHSTAPKVEPRPHAKGPGGVSQYGQMQGTHITHGTESGYRGDPVNIGPGYRNPVGPTNMALQGPGAGCNIMPHGGQGRHGPVAGTRPTAGRGILNNE